MQRKTKSKKKKPAPIPLPATENALITSLLQELGDSDPIEVASKLPDARLAQALIERLPLDNESSFGLLSAIYDHFENKKVHKAIKRTLFKLEKRGVRV